MSPHLKSTPALACQEYEAACRWMFNVDRLLLFCIYCFVQCQLRHCATSRKVAGSIPNGVIDVILLAALALGSTHPLTVMSTRNIFGGRGSGRCVGLTTLPPSWAVFLKSGSLNLLEPSGPVQACIGIALPLQYQLHGWALCSVTHSPHLRTARICFVSTPAWHIEHNKAMTWSEVADRLRHDMQTKATERIA
jgi:hypothetical protein